MTNEPLITLFVMTYNQEAFVAEALKSAFSQTYSPLEILVSDDCSTDKTFEIAQSLVASYNGPHHVVLTRNETNLGFIGNINKIFLLAKGELLVMNCGDDVSLPDRVKILADDWFRYDKKPYALVSSYWPLSYNGKRVYRPSVFKETGLVKLNKIEMLEKYPSYVGATAAYRPELMQVFGPITQKSYEDGVLFLRARLLGDLLVVKEKLLLYRQGGVSSCSTLNKTVTHLLDLELNVYRQFKSDIKRLDALISANEKGVEDRKVLMTGSLRERFNAYRSLRPMRYYKPVFYFLIAVLPYPFAAFCVALFFKAQLLRQTLSATRRGVFEKDYWTAQQLE